MKTMLMIVLAFSVLIMQPSFAGETAAREQLRRAARDGNFDRVLALLRVGAYTDRALYDAAYHYRNDQIEARYYNCALVLFLWPNMSERQRQHITQQNLKMMQNAVIARDGNQIIQAWESVYVRVKAFEQEIQRQQREQERQQCLAREKQKREQQRAELERELMQDSFVLDADEQEWYKAEQFANYDDEGDCRKDRD